MTDTERLATWMGWTREVWTLPPHGTRAGPEEHWRTADGMWIWDEPDFSRIADAWLLVERARKLDPPVFIKVTPFDTFYVADAECDAVRVQNQQRMADTAPAAICAAVLALIEG